MEGGGEVWKKANKVTDDLELHCAYRTKHYARPEKSQKDAGPWAGFEEFEDSKQANYFVKASQWLYQKYEKYGAKNPQELFALSVDREPDRDLRKKTETEAGRKEVLQGGTEARWLVDTIEDRRLAGMPPEGNPQQV
uniref:Uncharacterized protein n=1 Tax=Zooxanthella nutricula TaxID=1333877 RepID=A0A7S2P1I9_9DINO